ncbi:MAG: hypothetical protein HC802_18715 [Caldilineaceae bacterium]|nr:hypothetical protein [Caldilineaceae bacterium]
MATNTLIITLSKVLIAAAWADDELDIEEVNIMKDLLSRLPRASTGAGMSFTAVEWAEIEMYLEAPVGDAERTRLIDDLLDNLKTSDDTALVMQALDDLVQADGVVSDEDKAVIGEIRAAIGQLDIGDQGFFGHLSRLLTGPRERRRTALADAPNREKYFDDYIHNKVYYGVRRRLDLGEGVELAIDDRRLRLLSAAGGLMARVANVDLNATEEEFAAMTDALEEIWELSQEEAVFVVEVAISEVGPDLDLLRLVREIYSSIQPQQMDRLLDLLFAVAARRLCHRGGDGGDQPHHAHAGPVECQVHRGKDEDSRRTAGRLEVIAVKFLDTKCLETSCGKGRR